MPITFYGDPHGRFEPLLEEWERVRSHVVLLGDCDLERPLREVLAPIFEAGCQILWIIGNHDTDYETRYRNLADDHPAGDLGGRIRTVEGIRIGGLGGVYRKRIWRPGPDEEPPQFRTREAYLRSLKRHQLWRGGLPIRQRSAIFPEDHDLLGDSRFDILVTHEAPGSHKYGFTAIDDLAVKSGVRLIVHGHHHLSYTASIAGNIYVRGLGKAEPWTIGNDFFKEQ